MSAMKNIKEKILYSFLFFLFLLIDQASKLSATDIFKNYDFAFSIKLPQTLIYSIYLILLAALGYWFINKAQKNWQNKIAFVLILSGALSNIVERIYLGYVRDFIYIYNGVFNIADFFIISGIVILIII